MIAVVCSVWRSSSSPAHDHHLSRMTTILTKLRLEQQHCNISDTVPRVLRARAFSLPHLRSRSYPPLGPPKNVLVAGLRRRGSSPHKVSSLPTTKREGPERITSVQSSLGPGQPRPLHHLIASQCNSIQLSCSFISLSYPAPLCGYLNELFPIGLPVLLLFLDLCGLMRLQWCL